MKECSRRSDMCHRESHAFLCKQPVKGDELDIVRQSVGHAMSSVYLETSLTGLDGGNVTGDTTPDNDEISVL